MNLRTNFVNWAATAFTLIALLTFTADANACCSRKGDFGCCGNGPCNIFCCNCDGGCNQTCEDTSCNTAQWFECAGVCAACATACVVTEGEVCAQCMGPLYATCKGCYSSSTSALQSLKGKTPDKLAENRKASEQKAARDDFYKSIAKYDGNDAALSYDDFMNFMQNEIKRTAGKKKTSASIAEMFKAFDVNSNGYIDRSEIDNKNVKHGLID